MVLLFLLALIIEYLVIPELVGASKDLNLLGRLCASEERDRLTSHQPQRHRHRLNLEGLHQARVGVDIDGHELESSFVGPGDRCHHFDEVGRCRHAASDQSPFTVAW